MALSVRPSKLWLKITGTVVGVILVAAFSLGVIWLMGKDAPSPPVVSEPEPPTPVSASMNNLFFGNVFWGRYTHDWSQESPLKYEFPFDGLNDFDREQYTSWVGGLECPMALGANPTSAQQEATLSFNCRPEYLPEAAKWFTAFTLANNHTDNQGQAGFKETQQHLEENGIQYFGHYDPTLKSEACEVIALPADITYSDGSIKRQSLPVAMCGFHGVFQIPPANTIEEMNKYSPYMPVFAFPHMGAEYVAGPDHIKTTAYRSMIDNGADVVLGDHPHWIQTTESYKGHLIVYSMGNFMFDQQGVPELVRSAAINIKMDVDDDVALADWVELGETCAAFKDNCLEEAVEQNLQKLNYTYGFDVIGTNNDNKRVRLSTPAELNNILLRLRWHTTIQQLQPPYGGI